MNLLLPRAGIISTTWGTEGEDKVNWAVVYSTSQILKYNIIIIFMCALIILSFQVASILRIYTRLARFKHCP